MNEVTHKGTSFLCNLVFGSPVSAKLHGHKKNFAQLAIFKDLFVPKTANLIRPDRSILKRTIQRKKRIPTKLLFIFKFCLFRYVCAADNEGPKSSV